MYWLIYTSLMALALGLVTSISILALSHILIFIPGIYFLSKIEFKKLSKSTWSLLALTLFIVLSVIINHDIATNGVVRPILKAKYFLFGFLMIAPFQYFFTKCTDHKKIKYILYMFCLSTTIASVFGMIAMKTQFNYITWREVSPWRNAGLFGMGMNYAQNMAYFLIIILGLILHYKKIKDYINLKFLYLVFIVNFIGLYFSYTRGAILALLIGVPFYFFKNHKRWFLGAFVLLTILGTALYFVAGKSIIRPSSDTERISLWQAAGKAFQERPLLGFGYLNFEQHARDIKKRYNLSEPNYGGHAHNNFLEMLASTGILGTLAFLSWVFFWFLEVYRRSDLLASISLPFIVVFLISGMTQATITLGINLFFIMAVYALGQSLRPEPLLKRVNLK